MRAFKPIKKKSLAEEVADKLQKQIESGKLALGSKLPVEAELGAMFNVGRSSVREATKLLATRGYLSIEQGRGTFVKKELPKKETWEQKLQHADVKDLRESRDLLDVSFAQLAAKRCTDEDLAEMQKWLSEREWTASEGDLRACIEADVKFHFAIAKATHNQILIEVYRVIADMQTSSWQLMYDDTARLRDSQQRHVALFENIKKGDAEKIEGSLKDLLAKIWAKE